MADVDPMKIGSDFSSTKSLGLGLTAMMRSGLVKSVKIVPSSIKVYISTA